MTARRPWQSDAEIEGQMRGPAVIRFGPRAAPDRPWATYGLLLTFLGVFLLEVAVRAFSSDRNFYEIFTIQSSQTRYDWITRPWSPITATLSHSTSRPAHLLLNSLTLFFFGPPLENLLGPKRYLLFFFVAGATSSIAQALLAPGNALGASGAIMGLIGLTILLLPHSKILLFPIPVPVPIWVGGLLFIVLDLAGAMGGGTGIGNFAHLAGMALGLGYGWLLRRPARPRDQTLLRA